MDMHMTRLDALRRLLATPRDHADMGRIGFRRRVASWATADGRQRLSLVYRVLRPTRKAA